MSQNKASNPKFYLIFFGKIQLANRQGGASFMDVMRGWSLKHQGEQHRDNTRGTM